MRRRTVLVACFALAVLTPWPGSSPVAASARVTEWFHTIWIDSLSGSGISARRYVLIDDQDHATELHLHVTAPYMRGLQALNGRRVTIDGEIIAIESTAGRMDRLRVDSIQIESTAEGESQPVEGARAVVGPKPWVTILCRFADSRTTLQPTSWFQGLMGSTYPGMDHYWREVSDGQIDLGPARQ